VEQIYDQHHYIPEMAKAVGAYEEALRTILCDDHTSADASAAALVLGQQERMMVPTIPH
jgi:hypothetical protein